MTLRKRLTTAKIRRRQLTQRTALTLAARRKTVDSTYLRSIASSTAIETGEPTAAIEARLKAGNSRFKHLQLA